MLLHWHNPKTKGKAHFLEAMTELRLPAESWLSVKSVGSSGPKTPRVVIAVVRMQEQTLTFNLEESTTVGTLFESIADKLFLSREHHYLTYEENGPAFKLEESLNRLPGSSMVGLSFPLDLH